MHGYSETSMTNYPVPRLCINEVGILNAADRIQDEFSASSDSHDAEQSSAKYSNLLHEGRRKL